MPRKGSTSKSEQNNTPWHKKISSWLVQRLADLRTQSATRPATSLTVSPLITVIGHRFLGNNNIQLARQVFNRTNLSLSTFQAENIPLISGVSHFIMSKLTSSPTVWQPALSLPWIRQSQRRSARPSQTQYESLDWQPTDHTDSSSRNPQVTRQVQQYPASEEKQSDGEQVQPYQVISAEPLPLVTTTPFTQPINKRESLRTTDVSTNQNNLTNTFSGSGKEIVKRTSFKLAKAEPVPQEEYSVSSLDSTYPAVIKDLLSPPVSSRRLDSITHSLPFVTNQLIGQQQVGKTEESDVPKSSYIYHSELLKRGADEYQQNENADDRRIDSTQKKLDQVSQQRKNRYLTQPLSNLLTPITQRLILKRSQLASRSGTVREKINEYHTSPLQRTYEQKQILPEFESSSMTAKPATIPLVGRLTADRSPDESTENTDHTSITLISPKPITIQSKALTDQGLSLVKPVMADEISHRFSQSQLQKTSVRLDGLTSDPTSTPGITSKKGSEIFPFKQTQQPASKAGQSSMRDQVAGSLQQQTLEKARSTKTLAYEAKKSPRRAVIHRTIIEPDSAKQNIYPMKEVTSDRGSEDSPAKQTPQSVQKTSQSLMEEPITDSLQQQTPEEAKVLYTPVNEVIKSQSRPEVPRTAVEPNSEDTSMALPQRASQSDSSRELQYRLESRSKQEIGPTQTGEPIINRAFNGQEVSNPVTESGISISRDLVEGYTEKVLSYRSPLSFTSLITRPITVIRDIASTMGMPSQQLLKTTVHRHIYDKSKDQGSEYRTAFSDYRHTSQPPVTLSLTSQVRPKTESGLTINEKSFKYTSDTMPDLPYSGNHNNGNHNGLELALAPVSRMPDISKMVQKADQEPEESQGNESVEKEPALDIREIAREVYPYLKRMIMAERDRQPI